jgi:hypothetical protein
VGGGGEWSRYGRGSGRGVAGGGGMSEASEKLTRAAGASEKIKMELVGARHMYEYVWICMYVYTHTCV